MTDTSHDSQAPVSHSSDAGKSRPKIGLALGSGAARGWAHLGVMRALDELGIEVDVYAGCSAGALVAGAHLMGMLDDLADWARTIGPISAMSTFAVSVGRGGLINPDKAFDGFREKDKLIEDLPKPFGAVATDLATGKEVWLTKGSTIDALRASSAVPLVIQAASYKADGEEHWLVDGATSNPVPVNLARALGADRVISVDLMAVALGLSRFNRPTTRAVVPVPLDEEEPGQHPLASIESFFRVHGQDLARRIALARARSMAQPQFFETVVATMDIVQAQLADARARVDAADVRLTPNLSIGSAAAFDQWEAFEAIGYETAMAAAPQLQALAVAE